jgi:hypothetical protein
MGSWNSNIGDLLADYRFDGLTFHPDNADVLFRYYTRILLIASEILTDFQDVLTVFRNCNIDSVKKKGENDKSRTELTPDNIPGAIQKLFDYINTICKHKTRNIHACNHHIIYYFEDSVFPRPAEDFINIQNVASTMENMRTGIINDPLTHIIVPKLQYILQILVHGYQTLDRTFKNDSARFSTFCKLYETKIA